MRQNLLLLVTLLAASSASHGWSLTVDRDEMAGKESRSLAVESENDHTLSWPYGTISGRLIVRKHPRYGKDVIFTATKGQILCSSYSGCPIMVKFDDRPALKLNGTEPADHDSTMVFISGFDRIVTGLKTAKKTRIEVQFYQNGSRVFEFDTEDFDPSKLDPTPKAKPK